MANTPSSSWPVNSSGEIIFELGTGDTSKVANLPASQIPHNNTTDKVVIKMPPSVALVGTQKKIIAIGDSIVEFCQSFGRIFANPTNIGNSQTAVVCQGASLTCSQGNGTMFWDAANSTLTWTAPGDTSGPATKVLNGIYYLESGTAGNTLRVGVKYLLLPTTSQTDVIASGAAQWLRATGGWIYALDALTGSKFQWLAPLGISGDTTVGMVGNRYAQALASSADIILDEGGTNDISLSPNQLPPLISANRIAFWDQCGTAGKTVLAFLISPRWGRDEAGTPGADAAKFTATLQARIVATNRLLIAASQSRPWVRIVDTYTACTDATQSTGRVKDGWTPAGDGLHPGGAMAFYGYAIPAAKILNTLVPDDSSFLNVGAGSYYDAVNNPGGNLLNSNQGSFAGTGGTTNTGTSLTPAWVTSTVYAAQTYVIASGNLYYTASGGTSGATIPSHPKGSVSDGAVTWDFVYAGASTGFAAGLSSQRSGTTITGTYHKVASTDGGPDWQACRIKNATADTENIGLFFANPTFSRMAAGIDTIVYKGNFQIVGSGCYGVYIDYTITNGGVSPLPNVQAFQLRNNFAGLRDVSGTIATEPLLLQAGTTDIFPRAFVQSLPGADFEVRWRIFNINKIL